MTAVSGASAYSIEPMLFWYQTLSRASAELLMDASTYDFCQNLVKEAQARRTFTYDDVKASNDIKVMFKGVTVVHPKGEVKMLAVRYAPSNAVRVLTTKDWELACGEGTTPIFNPFMNGGQLDEPADDSVQIRHKLLACLTCMAPGHSGVAQIA